MSNNPLCLQGCSDRAVEQLSGQFTNDNELYELMKAGKCCANGSLISPQMNHRIENWLLVTRIISLGETLIQKLLFIWYEKRMFFWQIGLNNVSPHELFPSPAPCSSIGWCNIAGAFWRFDPPCERTPMYCAPSVNSTAAERRSESRYNEKS